LRILIIEDDQVTAQFLCKGLTQAGHSAVVANTGTIGLDLALNDNFDAVLIDPTLPEFDGLSIITRMRNQSNQVPVLILSAKCGIDDLVTGLNHGGDDYLTKPFSFSELLARLNALLRRSCITQRTTRHVVHDLELDVLKHTVLRSGKKIYLQPREFALLRYLMANTGNIVSKTMIMERVWNYQFDPNTNVVEARICKLRKKIDKHYEVPLIHTVRGAGYVLRSDINLSNS